MFKFLIEGKTIKELKENIVEFFNEFESLQPGMEGEGEQEDFLTDAAAAQPIPFTEPSVPFAPVMIQKESCTETPVPVTPPTPIVPMQSATPSGSPMVSPNPGGVDSKGFPWDDRIHASSRSLNKDGTWRYKRGVEDAQIRQVEQELVGKARGIQAQEMVSLPPIPVVPPLQPVAPVIPEVPQAPVAPPAIPMPSPVAAIPNAHTAETFRNNLIPVLAKMVKDGKLTQDYINTLKQHFGVDEIHKVTDAQADEMFSMFVHYGMLAKAE